ncbi:hypothetical protein GCM10008905_09170 [Clostridium malenominatum]|uniref:ABC transporter permease n=1 Tax=Clostridium malenominatum TaxID=1539 RepID=A0ABN1IRZ9_9CLOT
MKNKLEILLFKIKVGSKVSLPLVIFVILYPFLLFLRSGQPPGQQSVPVGTITLLMAVLFFQNVKFLETFLRFGGSRIRYFKYRLSEAFITSLAFIVLLWIYYYFIMREDINFNIMIKLSIYYFVYIFLCFSTKIFAEIVNKSQYLAISYSMIFFYAILFLRYGIWLLVSSIDTIMLNFNQAILWELIIIIFNIWMSYIALKTIEVH